jgi:hypothetical protein
VCFECWQDGALVGGASLKAEDFLGIIAGAIPAFQAMQLRISEALRRGG